MGLKASKEGPKRLKELDQKHKSYLHQLWKNLRMRGKSEETVDKITFLKFFDLPGVLAERVWYLFDFKMNNVITEEEFMSVMAWYMMGKEADKTLVLFKIYDMDERGTVNAKEMKIMFGSLVHMTYLIPGITDDQCVKVNELVKSGDTIALDDFLESLIASCLEKYDVSRTGTLNYEEFSSAVASSHNTLVELDTSFNQLTQCSFFELENTGERMTLYRKRQYLGFEKLNVSLIGRILYFFKNAKSSKPRKVVFLAGLKVKAFSDDGGNKRYHGYHIKSEYKTITVYAKGDAANKWWQEALNEVSGTRNLRQLYDVGKVIGRGAYGVVTAAVQRETGVEVAVKSLDKTKLNDLAAEGLRSEVAVLKLLNHPRIIDMLDEFDCSDRIDMVLELVMGGDLQVHLDQMMKEKQVFVESEVKQLAFQVFSALQHCHARGIVHRDLKPENLLMRKLGDITDIVITDFGLSRFTEPTTVMLDQIGSFCYMAPEVMITHCYTYRVDVWSAGAMLFELLTNGRLPFEATTERELRNKIKTTEADFTLPEWKGRSEEAKDCVKQMLIKKPYERISVEAVLAHPWLAGVKDERSEEEEKDDDQPVKAKRKAYKNYTSTKVFSQKQSNATESTLSSMLDLLANNELSEAHLQELNAAVKKALAEKQN